MSVILIILAACAIIFSDDDKVTGSGAVLAYFGARAVIVVACVAGAVFLELQSPTNFTTSADAAECECPAGGTE